MMSVFLILSAVLPLSPQEPTWSNRLGYPADKRVIILHADDVGMCYEANAAAQRALAAGRYQSAAVMMPCPWAGEMLDWCKARPGVDVGLHLALTSEWKHYRWGPVAPREKVKGLLDSFGFFHRNVPGVAFNARPEEVAAEIRAQFDRAVALGWQPGHLDTHMGTLYARPEFTKAYLDLAVEKQVPAMVIEMTPRTIAKFKQQGYPFSEAMLGLIADYPLPKLDDFHSVESARTYDEKKSKFLAQVRGLPPGLHEIIFHPSVETEGLKKITNSWQQRVWEDKLFDDPEVQQFLKDEGVIVSNWKEVMRRFTRKP